MPIVHLLVAALLALSAAQTARIDAIVATTMRAGHVAGVSLGIARRGTLLYLRGYGLRALAPDVPADGYTIYYAGSVTKQFTAALALQEAQAGRLALDAPLARYLPDPGAYGSVTIAQLLGQTSGIPSYTDRPDAGLLRLAAANPSPDALWRLVADVPPALPPGAAWEYSNTNYLLLGMVLERVAARSYPALLQHGIIAPLGLRSTSYGTPATARNVARGYRWRDGFVEIPMTRGTLDVAFSAGALSSNVPDLLAWLEALRAGRVVAPPDAAAMTTSVRLRDGIPARYGFGFFTGDWYGYRVAFHGGLIDGFSSEDALVLDDGLEVAVMSNADRFDLQPLARSLVAIADPPLDRNLYAAPQRPAENENPAITAEVDAIAATPAFAALGPLQLVEFVERNVEGAITYDRYRLTFASGQWRLTVGYVAGGRIESLSLVPDAA